MTAMSTLHVPPDGWTVDDLPDDADARYELVDGALLVSPPESARNTAIAGRLLVLLAPSVGPEWEVLVGGGCYFDNRNFRVPDLLVARRDALDGVHLDVSDVLLAVEVMSPGSVSNDRVAKPAQYAAAGIPHFWRFERAPRVLVIHALDGDVYRETGRYDDRVDVALPVPLSFALTDLYD